MNSLREEQNEVQKMDGVIVRTQNSANAIDKFFEMLEVDPEAFMDHNHTDICEYTRLVEKTRCIRKVVVFKSRLEQLYEEFGAFQIGRAHV